jgi:HSP20 family protein
LIVTVEIGLLNTSGRTILANTLVLRSLIMIPALFHRPRVESSLRPMSRNIDQIFDEFVDWFGGNGLSASEETAAYPVDVREEDGQIIIDAEMPGFEKDEVDVTLERGVLNISAEHKEENEKKEKGKTHLHERRYRRIQRTFSLPAAVDESHVDAKLKDGVLHLTLHKKKEAIPHKIEIA